MQQGSPLDCCIVGIGQGYAACKLSIRCNEVARRVGILAGYKYSVLDSCYQVDIFGPAMFYKAVGLVTSRRRLSFGFFGKVIYRTGEATSAGYSVSKSHIDACICCALASSRDCTRLNQAVCREGGCEDVIHAAGYLHRRRVQVTRSLD